MEDEESDDALLIQEVDECVEDCSMVTGSFYVNADETDSTQVPSEKKKDDDSYEQVLSQNQKEMRRQAIDFLRSNKSEKKQKLLSLSVKTEQTLGRNTWNRRSFIGATTNKDSSIDSDLRPGFGILQM
jgi:hypothetical protein